MGWNCPECGQSEGEPSGYVEKLETKLEEYHPKTEEEAYERFKNLERYLKTDDDQDFKNTMADIDMIVRGKYPT